MKKIFSSLLSIMLLLVAFFIPKLALADGMGITYDPYADRWDFSNETNQQAFINYEDGLEKMIISTGFSGNKNNGTVWLFPIPTTPDKIAIDVVKNLPTLSGTELTKQFKSESEDMLTTFQQSQIYTLPFIFIKNALYSATGSTGSDFITQKSTSAPLNSDVIVYEHLDKEGISSEIITAKTADGIYNYLTSKGLKIESGAIPVLNNYIGKNYSFVASWISQPETITTGSTIKAGQPKQKMSEIEFKAKFEELNSQKGIFVTFPTKEIYFPLLPTSVYGSKIVPATIRVFGYVSPKVFKDIKSFVKTEYYNGEYSSSGFADNLKTFYNGSGKKVSYTKIEINAPSKFFTDDLWFDNKAPLINYFVSFLMTHQIAWGITLFILCSILASILAGFTVFKDLRGKPLKLILFGLSNCLTLLGLIVVLSFTGTKNENKDKNIDLLYEKIKKTGYFWRRRITMLFCILSFILIVLDIIPFLLGILLTFAILPAILDKVSPIKKENEAVFEQLESYGYSSWSFKPKDKMKYAFVPLFSGLFLLFSWGAVKIIEMML